MRLEIGNFYVKDIVFGNELSYEDGILTIEKEAALNYIRQDERITEAELYIAKPGDQIRMCPVKEAIEPRVRPDGRSAFPGYTGDMTRAGEGVTYALKNCSVLVVGRHWGGFQDGIIDMSGEGQKYTLFGQLMNIVLVADTNEEFEKHEQQKKNDALRRAGHKLAEYIANCVKELEPEETEVFDLGAMIKRGEEVEKLPSVVYVMQPQSQMEELGYNDLAYGWDMNRMLPTVMNPNEVLDGAIVSGSFMPVSSKWSTYDFQNCPNIKALYKEHGKTINFLGVIKWKSTHNRRECPVYGHRGGSRGRFYYRITTFEGRPWDARDPHKTTFMTLKHAIRLSIWRKQKETPGVEKAPGVSSPQRKESGRSGRDDGELRFGYDPAIHARRLRVYHRPRRLRMALRISIILYSRRFSPANLMG